VTTLRRFLVVAALMFWQGGFVFYAAVVVPVGRDKIGSLQSYVTQYVTDYLNLSGAIALLLLAWDVLASSVKKGRRWALWLIMAAALAVLVWLHIRLEDSLNPEGPDWRAFTVNHRLYLWTSTVQWGCAVLFTLISLQVWKSEDGMRSASAELSA
jgi:hypothetical protein